MPRRRNPAPTSASGDSWQQLAFTVESDDQREFSLPFAPAVDADGDPKVRLDYSGGSYNAPDDFTTSGATLTWAGAIPLTVGESITLWIVPST